MHKLQLFLLRRSHSNQHINIILIQTSLSHVRHGIVQHKPQKNKHETWCNDDGGSCGESTKWSLSIAQFERSRAGEHPDFQHGKEMPRPSILCRIYHPQ